MGCQNISVPLAYLLSVQAALNGFSKDGCSRVKCSAYLNRIAVCGVEQCLQAWLQQTFDTICSLCREWNIVPSVRNPPRYRR